jgi:hypothetical protein
MDSAVEKGTVGEDDFTGADGFAQLRFHPEYRIAL